MSLKEDVEEIRKQKEKEYENDSTYRTFIENYQELIRRGFIKKNEYEIPPVDTIGKRLIQLSEKA